jgi:hypothetical protein
MINRFSYSYHGNKIRIKQISKKIKTIFPHIFLNFYILSLDVEQVELVDCISMVMYTGKQIARSQYLGRS